MYDTVECLRLCNLFRVNFSIDSLNCELRCFGFFEEKKRKKIFVPNENLSDRAYSKSHVLQEKKNLFIHVQHQKIVQNRCNYFLWVNILGHIHFINNF